MLPVDAIANEIRKKSWEIEYLIDELIEKNGRDMGFLRMSLRTAEIRSELEKWERKGKETQNDSNNA